MIDPRDMIIVCRNECAHICALLTVNRQYRPGRQTLDDYKRQIITFAFQCVFYEHSYCIIYFEWITMASPQAFLQSVNPIEPAYPDVRSKQVFISLAICLHDFTQCRSLLALWYSPQKRGATTQARKYTMYAFSELPLYIENTSWMPSQWTTTTESNGFLDDSKTPCCAAIRGYFKQGLRSFESWFNETFFKAPRPVSNYT